MSMGKEKVEELFRKLSNIKLSSFQVEEAKHEASQSLLFYQRKTKNHLASMEEKLFSLEHKLQTMGKIIQEQQQNRTHQLHETNLPNSQIPQILTNYQHYLHEKTKLQVRLLKNKKNSFVSAHTQLTSYLATLLDRVNSLQQFLMTNKIQTAEKGKEIKEKEEKELDERIKKQEEELEEINEIERRLQKCCDGIQKEGRKKIEEEEERTEKRRVRICNKIQELLKQININ